MAIKGFKEKSRDIQTLMSLDKNDLRHERAVIAQEKYKRQKAKNIAEGRLPPGIVRAHIYYPLTKLMLWLMNAFEGSSIQYLHAKKVKTPTGRPIIYANTHRFKPDMEKITLSLNRASCLMVSDFKNSYRTINGWYFNTRPTLFVDPYDKEDRHCTYKMMVKYLQADFPCMIFPEGVWNLSENIIILNTFYGTVKAALETNAVIVCTAIERYGKNYIINRNGYIDPTETLKKYTRSAYGKLTDEDAEIKSCVVSECNRQLRDTLATLTMEIWIDHAEQYGIESRAELPSDYWDTYLASVVSEWPGYKMSDNVEQRFHSKAQIEYDAVQRSLARIGGVGSNAAGKIAYYALDKESEDTHHA